MFINIGGAVGLSHSVFVSNDANGSASEGITNLGGRVQCDPTECLPVCTSCRDGATPLPLEYDVDELPPARWDDKERTSLAPDLLVYALVTSVALVLLVVVAVWRRGQCATSGPTEQQTTEVEMGDRVPTKPLPFDYTAVSRVDDAGWSSAQAEEPLASRDGNPPSSISSASTSVPLSVNPCLDDETPARHRELTMNFFVALRSSPALIFVVDTEMQIVLWSRGAV